MELATLAKDQAWPRVQYATTRNEWVYAAYARTPVDRDKLADLLERNARRVATETIRQEAAKLGLNGTVKLNDAVLLADLRYRAEFSAASIVRTYNRELAKQVDRAIADNPKGNRQEIASQLREWYSAREASRAELVANTETWTVVSWAKTAFYERNKISAQCWFGGSLQCKLCQGWAGDNPYTVDDMHHMGPGPHYGCFLDPETRIVTLDGERPIASLREGDRVLTHLGRFQPVVKVFRNTYTGIAVRRGDILATADHPILTEHGWKQAGELQTNDRIAVYLGQREPQCDAFDEFVGELMASGADHNHVDDGVLATERTRQQVVDRSFAFTGRAAGLAGIVGRASDYDGLFSVASPQHVVCLGSGVEVPLPFGLGFGATQIVACDHLSELFRVLLSPLAVLMQSRFAISRIGRVLLAAAHVPTRHRQWHHPLFYDTEAGLMEHMPVVGATTWNIAVAADESYIANGVVVHNCKDVWTVEVDTSTVPKHGAWLGG